jgi:hypothetical protein
VQLWTQRQPNFWPTKPRLLLCYIYHASLLYIPSPRNLTRLFRTRTWNGWTEYKVKLRPLVNMAMKYLTFSRRCWCRCWSSVLMSCGLVCGYRRFRGTYVSGVTPWNCGSSFLWNVGVYRQIRMVLQYRRPAKKLMKFRVPWNTEKCLTRVFKAVPAKRSGVEFRSLCYDTKIADRKWQNNVHIF